MFKFLKKLSKSDIILNITRDLKSQRVLWTYFTGILYAFVIVFGVITYPECLDTAIQVTGGVLTLVFGGYVFSKQSDKKIEAMKEMNGPRRRAIND